MVHKYSVLIPVYFKEKPEYFRTSLDSMLNQTIPPSELVIIEDGMLTEELEAVVIEYEKNYDIVKVVRNDKHQGLGLTLRDGVLHCSCDYIARMDSDDISEPTRMEQQFKILDQHPDYDLIGSIYDEFLEVGVQGPIRMLPETPDAVLKFSHKRNPFGHSSLLIKKESILFAGNYRDYPGFEDYDLWNRMLTNGVKGYNIQQVLVHVRGGNDFYNRRGGRAYLKTCHGFFKKYRKCGYISWGEYISTMIARTITYLVPGSVRKMVYRNMLRK